MYHINFTFYLNHTKILPIFKPKIQELSMRVSSLNFPYVHYLTGDETYKISVNNKQYGTWVINLLLIKVNVYKHITVNHHLLL